LKTGFGLDTLVISKWKKVVLKNLSCLLEEIPKWPRNTFSDLNQLSQRTEESQKWEK
jgi:hypothetical protein